MKKKLSYLLHSTSTDHPASSNFALKSFECEYFAGRATKTSLETIWVRFALGQRDCTIMDLATYPKLCALQISFPSTKWVSLEFQCYCGPYDEVSAGQKFFLQCQDGITFQALFKTTIGKFRGIGGRCGGVENVVVVADAAGAEG